MSNKYSPETLSFIKLWVINTPPSPSILQKKESDNIYKQEIKKLTPDTFNIIKSWIEKTPPQDMFELKRKSIEEFKL
jgi:hypothetical protein